MAPQQSAPHFFAKSQQCVNSPLYADFTIFCEGKEYKVNRQLLACHSNWFKTLFESKFKESTESSVTLRDDNMDAVAFMMTYFYKLDYGNEATSVKDHAEVYVLAEKYDIPDLKALAVKKFRLAAGQPPVDTCTLLPVLRIIYDNTTSSHREIRSAAIDSWLQKQRVPSTEDEAHLFTNSLCAIPEFTAELAVTYARAFSSSYSKITTGHCVCGSLTTVSAFEELKMKECPQCHGLKDVQLGDGSLTVGVCGKKASKG